VNTGRRLRYRNIYSRSPEVPRGITGSGSGKEFLCRVRYGRAPAVLEYLQQEPGSTQRNYWERKRKGIPLPG